MAEALTVSGLDCFYGEVQVLHSLSLELRKGEVLLTGEPRTAIATLSNQVWRKTLRTEELAECQQRFTILSTRLVGGAPVIHVLSADQPDHGPHHAERLDLAETALSAPWQDPVGGPLKSERAGRGAERLVALAPSRVVNADHAVECDPDTPGAGR